MPPLASGIVGRPWPLNLNHYLHWVYELCFPFPKTSDFEFGAQPTPP